ncbi:MAG: serine hydrolase [Acidobacteriota bacterium]
MFSTTRSLTLAVFALTATVAASQPSLDRGRDRGRGGSPHVGRDCFEGPGHRHRPLRSRACARRNVHPPIDWAEVDALVATLASAPEPSREAMTRLQAPPEYRDDAGPRSWDLMDALVDDMRRVEERRRRDQPLLRRAILRVEEAAASQRELDAGRVRPLAGLQLAAQDLEAALDARQLGPRAGAEFLQRVADIARSLAVEALDLFESTGAGRDSTADMQALLDLSDDLMSRGPVSDGLGPLMDLVSNDVNMKFDRATFIQNIRDTFDDETVGYAFSVVEDGVMVHADGIGLARKTADGLLEQNQTYRMNIASVSKTITATAVLQLLDEKNVSPTSSIIDWLPTDWEPDESIEDVTFENLMKHRSGLNDNANDSYGYNSLKSYIEANNASTPEDRAVYAYQNTNYAMFRIILPYLWGFDPAEVLPAVPADLAHAVLYVVYVREYVLKPAFVFSASCDQDSTNAALEYNFADDTVAGTHPGNWTLWSGGGGWYLSAVDLARFLGALSQDGTLLSAEARAYMESEFTGWNNPQDWSWGYGAHGVYRNHGGDLGIDNDSGMDVCVMKYTNGIQAGLLINSRLGTYNYQCVELRDAFDDAWYWED